MTNTNSYYCPVCEDIQEREGEGFCKCGNYITENDITEDGE